MKAMDTAAKVSTVGNHMVLCIQSSQMATKPSFAPKASPTQRKTPPFCGHAVVNSAATSETGIKKKSAAKR